MMPGSADVSALRSVIWPVSAVTWNEHSAS